MFFKNIYYQLKPLIPRRIQIELRRRIIIYKRIKYSDIWPIDERAGIQPEGWRGWPKKKQFALVLTHDVEGEKGIGKVFQVAEIEKNLGFRSCFNFVGQDYPKSAEMRRYLSAEGFEIGLHGLRHVGNLFEDKKEFKKKAEDINKILWEYGIKGFRTPSMYHNLEMLCDLDIEYDSSTFDTDPFEPQPDSVGTIFPFRVSRAEKYKGYIEMPYTLPQDFALFVLMREKNIYIWKQKTDWIAEKSGMALLNTHPDYMNFGNTWEKEWEYPANLYKQFLEYVKSRYEGHYWHILPGELSLFWEKNYGPKGFESGSKINSSESYRENKRVLYVKTIWIDLDNSPHVPFFNPIIRELNDKGYRVFLTARKCAQTCGLADLFGMQYKAVGQHYGKNKFLKIAGTIYRALLLTQTVRGEKPILALSHGSRALTAAARVIGIPSIVIADYEHAKGFLSPNWLMMPEVISENAIHFNRKHILRYPGIKEDVYVPYFKPNERLRYDLGIRDEEIAITIRPPATEAHYHNPESEILFNEVVNFLGAFPDVRLVILPRNDNQETLIKNIWSEMFAAGKIVIPERVVDGLNLLWNSDLAISGGGTMNREAAALGVPVYSIFRGKIGDVDRYLSNSGRLILLESVEDIKRKVEVKKMNRPKEMMERENNTLEVIVEEIIKVLEGNK